MRSSVSFHRPFHLALFAPGLLAILWTPSTLHADSDTHYQDYLVGERAAGMGGAFVALANEATGAYYNPAGIIAERSTLIQLSMSAYKLRHKEVKVAEICGTTISDKDDGFFGFPGSLGFAQQFRTGTVAHALGLTVVVPHWDRSSQLFTGADKQIRCGQQTLSVGGSQLNVDRVFWGGITYAIKPWKFLQFGATVGFSIRSSSYNLLATILAHGKDEYPIIAFQNLESVHWSFFAQLGAIVTLPRGFHLGLTFTTPHVRISGSGRTSIVDASGEITDTTESKALVIDELETFWKVPFRIGLGAAYRHGGRFTVALDVSLHGAVDHYPLMRHPRLSSTDDVLFNQRNVVVNVNLGGELVLGKKGTLRAGFFTNLTSYPDTSSMEDFDHVQKVGFTLGGTLHTTRRSALSLALQGQVGQVKATAVRISMESSVPEDIEVEATDLSLIISVGGRFDLK